MTDHEAELIMALERAARALWMAVEAHSGAEQQYYIDRWSEASTALTMARHGEREVEHVGNTTK